MERDGGEVVSAGREVRRDGGQVSLCSDLEHEAHADHDVEEEVAMEQPEAGVGGSETKDDVAVVRDSDGVLRGR